MTNPARYYNWQMSYEADRRAQRRARREVTTLHRQYTNPPGPSTFWAVVLVLSLCVALFIATLAGTSRTEHPLVTPTTVVNGAHLIPPVTIFNTNTNTNKESSK